MGSAGSQESSKLKTSSAPQLTTTSFSDSPPHLTLPPHTPSGSCSPTVFGGSQSPMSISSSEYSFMLSPSYNAPFADMLEGKGRQGAQHIRSHSVPVNANAPIMNDGVNLGGKDGLSLYMDTETMIRNLVLPHTSTEYRNVFLLTFRAYLSPDELLDKMLAYYSHPVINPGAEKMSLPATPTLSSGISSPVLGSNCSTMSISENSPTAFSSTVSSNADSRYGGSSSNMPSSSSSQRRLSSSSQILSTSPPRRYTLSSPTGISTTPARSPMDEGGQSSSEAPGLDTEDLSDQTASGVEQYEIIENYTPTPTTEESPIALSSTPQQLSPSSPSSPSSSSAMQQSPSKPKEVKKPPSAIQIPVRPEFLSPSASQHGGSLLSRSVDENMADTFDDVPNNSDNPMETSERHNEMPPKRHKDRDESKSLPQLPAHWRDSLRIPHRSSLAQTPQEIQHSRRIQKLQNMSRIKVAGVLQHWIRDFFEDFSPSMRKTLRDFASEIEQQRESLQNSTTTLCPLNTVIRVLDSKEQHSKLTAPTKNGAILEQEVRWVVNHEDFPDKLIIEKYGGGIDLLELNPEQIAQQLTLIEFTIFDRIRLVELTDQSWTKKPPPPTDNANRTAPTPKKRKRGIDVPAPNALYFIKQFNRMSYWCATEILLAETIEDRCDMMCLMLEIAHHSLILQNIHLCMAICAGLKLPQVSRLKHLKPVTKNGKHGKLFKKLEGLISAKSNYRQMRELFEECMKSGRPTLPFMAVVFKDLFALQERTQAEKDSDTIDIRRLCKSAKLVQQIASCQNGDYSKIIPSNDSLQHKLREEISRAMSEKDLRVRSLNLERKMTWEEHQQTVMIDALLNEGFL